MSFPIGDLDTLEAILDPQPGETLVSAAARLKNEVRAARYKPPEVYEAKIALTVTDDEPINIGPLIDAETKEAMTEAENQLAANSPTMDRNSVFGHVYRTQ